MVFNLGKLGNETRDIREYILELEIDGRKISPNNSNVFIIAEIGNNHNGSVQRAIKLIDDAVSSGADCVKFQMRNLETLYRKSSLNKDGEDLSTEYILDLLNKFELSLDEHYQLFNYCKKKGVTYMCTPWDLDSLSVLEKMGVVAYKVASADLTNIVLLEALVKTAKPLIISTGMSSEQEIQGVIHFLNERSANYALLHCNSTYPAPFHGINLNFLKTLQDWHPLVGYSGHERGTAVTLAAVGLGAKVVERHFTESRDMEGPDHAASLEKREFSELVKGIREIEEALGQEKRVLSQGELINRENLGKSIVATKYLKKGRVIQRDDLDVKSPGRGLSPLFLNDLIGLELKRDIKEEDFFYEADLKPIEKREKSFEFSRTWGIPVRYYDFSEMVDAFEPELVEFHLSYSDMDLDPSNYLNGPYDIDFVVHAPELFKDSHLMDLATTDQEYLKKSLAETQRVINITRELKKYFPKTKKPVIVANIGGFSRDSFLNEETKKEYYHIFGDSLKKLDTQGVEFSPQTMAPFPWHFGGQRYQNLFVHPNEIAEWADRFSLKICLDVSHSALVCNYFNYDILDFINIVGPYVSHLHLGDSLGLDGEGLQVGEGNLNFVEIGNLLKKVCPEASFIPEIWQGHKNSGEGFYLAFQRLSGLI